MQEATVVDRVRSMLEQRGTACPLHVVTQLCPDLNWNQVFLALELLKRTGQIDVTLDARRGYRVRIHRQR
jgi:hypothetical protein